MIVLSTVLSTGGNGGGASGTTGRDVGRGTRGLCVTGLMVRHERMHRSCRLQDRPRGRNVRTTSLNVMPDDRTTSRVTSTANHTEARHRSHVTCTGCFG